MQHACVMARSFHIWPLPVFTCTQERACTRCAATYAREHSISHEEYPMVVERTRVVSLVDQWDTLPRRIPCDYASIVVHHTTIER